MVKIWQIFGQSSISPNFSSAKVSLHTVCRMFVGSLVPGGMEHVKSHNYYVLCFVLYSYSSRYSFVSLCQQLSFGSTEHAVICCWCSGSYVCALLFLFLVLCMVSGSMELFFLFVLLPSTPYSGNLTVPGFPQELSPRLASKMTWSCLNI